MCACACVCVCVCVQPGITPFRAHAHKRYSSMNRVPEQDFPTFFVLHRTKCKPRHLNRVRVRVRIRVRVRVRVMVRVRV